MNETIESLEEMLNYFTCSGNCNGLACDVCEGNLILMQELFEDEEMEEEIELKQWTQDVYQLKLKSEIKSIQECVDLFISCFQEFHHHIHVKKIQSSFFRQSVAASTDENVVIQVDFAENYKCGSQNEVQSAYFNQHAIAIFTVVIWAGDRKFSKVIVTDETSHSKYCVVVFLHEIINDLKSELPNLKSVKIFSDGCTCQFKNRWILSLLIFSEDLFGVKMTWDFFAPGHGKGAVDGVGGTVKRAVYQRVLTRHAQVYTAKDFHQCITENIRGISSSLVPVEMITKLETALSDKWKRVKQVPGISKFFSFKPHNEKNISAFIDNSDEVGKTFKMI